MPRQLFFAVCLVLALAANGQDAVETDGDKYTVLLENDCVRVLAYKDIPGDRTHEHHHPQFVLYSLSEFKRTITLPTGKVLTRAFKPGDVMWSEAQTHVGENVGETPTHVILMELKKLATGPEACAET